MTGPKTPPMPKPLRYMEEFTETEIEELQYEAKP